MAQLNDLYDKLITEMTDEELEQKIHSLKKLKVYAPKVTKTVKLPSTNKDKQVNDLLKTLSPEDLEKLLSELSNGGKK